MLKTKDRSSQTEIMDDFSMEGELLRKTLDKIAWINKWLGGNNITLDGVKKLMSKASSSHELSIIDLGCGNGDMLRLLADYGRKQGIRFRLVGIDANSYTIAYARNLSESYPEISYVEAMIPSDQFSQLNGDIILSTLFLHHFSDKQALSLLQEMYSKASLGIVINDLQRSKWAYILFRLLTLFIPNPMVRKDGLTSILRGFKRKELEEFEKGIMPQHSLIQWRWAFRYQWIMWT